MGERCVHVTNRRWHWGGRRPPNPPDAPRMTHHPDVPRDRSHRRGLASGEGVRYIALSSHRLGSSPLTRGTWRIRLVAYGARLESVLGASPRGFESPILRRSFR